MFSKSQLREHIKKKILLMSNSERLRQSKNITQQLLNHPKVKNASKISLFISLMTEPSTSHLIKTLEKAKEIYIPSFKDINDTQLSMIRNSGEEIISPSSLEVIIVPGRAFTTDGDRLGRGGGHYDRYLSKINPECYKIGICFNNQIVPELPVDPWDIQMDEIITFHA